MKPLAVPGRRRRPAAPGRPLRGVTLVELLVVMAIIGALLAFGVPAVGKTFRRMEGSSALSGVSRILTGARLAAIKGVSGATPGNLPAPVVVLFEKGGTGEQIRIRSFVDANQDYDLTAGERTIDDVVLADRFHFWKQGEAKDDLSKAVLFSSYQPPTATSVNTALTYRMVFLTNGSIAVPQNGACGRPTLTAGRGIYFADRDGLNYFRVTIHSDSVARPIAEKWVQGATVAETGYSSSGWSWL